MFATAFALGGAAIITIGIAKGLPSTDSAGRLTCFALGFAILAVGVSGLRGPGDASGWDDFDDTSRASRWATRIALIVLVPALAIVTGTRSVGLWQHLRERHAQTLAAKHGGRVPTGHTTLARREWTRARGKATPASRCTAVLRKEYKRPGSALRNRFPAHAFALVAPQVCALGIQHGLVRNAGTISDESERELLGAAIGTMIPRVQTRVLNELAVTQYHLARRGHTERWHRCVAMGYSGYDALRGGPTLPPRALFFHAVRHACAVGVVRRIVPASGVPAADSAKSVALQRILSATFQRLSH